MKIYIIGGVGSGKTTLARRLSKETGIIHYELDVVTWEYNPHGNDRKRTLEEIEPLFLNILGKESWIIENVGKEIYNEGYKKADIIIYLKLSRWTLYKRIFFRWIKQNLGIESAPSKPTIKMLRQFLIWANKELRDSKLNKLTEYQDKIVILNGRQMKRYSIQIN